MTISTIPEQMFFWGVRWLPVMLVAVLLNSNVLLAVPPKYTDVDDTEDTYNDQSRPSNIGPGLTFRPAGSKPREEPVQEKRYTNTTLISSTSTRDPNTGVRLATFVDAPREGTKIRTIQLGPRDWGDGRYDTTSDGITFAGYSNEGTSFMTPQQYLNCVKSGG